MSRVTFAPFALAIAATEALPNPSTLCLPKVHSTFVHGYSDKVEQEGHSRPQEFRQGEVFQVFFDSDNQKSLVWVHPQNARPRSDPDHGMLTDYAKKLQWRWDWDAQSQKVSNCALTEMNEPQEPYCFGGPAEVTFNATGTGTTGESYPVDFWEGRFEKQGFAEDIFVVMQAKSTSIPVEEIVHGEFQERGEQGRYYERFSFWNFTSAAIDQSLFDVPSECPK